MRSIRIPKAIFIGLLLNAALLAVACAPQPAAPQPAAQQSAVQPATLEAVAQPATFAGPKVAAPASAGIFSDWTSEQWAAHMPVKVVEKMDSSGPAVVNPKDGDLYFYTNASTTWGSDNPKNSVWVVDAKTKKTVAVSDLPDKYALGFGSHNLGVSADGKWVYLPALKGATNYLLILDARTLKINKVLQDMGGGVKPISGRPHHVKNFHTTDGRDLILVEDFRGGANFYVLDPSQDNAVVGGMNGGDLLSSIYVVAPSPDGSFLYASVRGGAGPLSGGSIESTVFHIDPKTWTVASIVAPLRSPNWATFSADSKTAWLTLNESNQVVKIDTKTDTVLDTITTGAGPYGDQLSYDETKLYVADKGEAAGYNQQSRTITVIDTASDVVIKQIAPVGRTTDHVVLSPDGKEIWAQSNADHGIWIIDTATDEITQNIKAPNDGDVHGGAFVRFYNDAGTIKSETVSDITGLLGSARAAQVAYLKTPKTLVKVTPPKPALGQGGSFRPDTITVAPGSTTTIRFFNSSGTSGGNSTLDASAIGAGKFDLAAGQSKYVDFKAPAQPGTFTVTDPNDTQKTVFTVIVK